LTPFDVFNATTTFSSDRTPCPHEESPTESQSGPRNHRKPCTSYVLRENTQVILFEAANDIEMDMVQHNHACFS